MNFSIANKKACLLNWAQNKAHILASSLWQKHRGRAAGVKVEVQTNEKEYDYYYNGYSKKSCAHCIIETNHRKFLNAISHRNAPEISFFLLQIFYTILTPKTWFCYAKCVCLKVCMSYNVPGSLIHHFAILIYAMLKSHYINVR